MDANRDADRWGALADGTRRAIVACLADGPQAVGQLAAGLRALVRQAMKDLPELRASGLGNRRVDLVLRLVERLDGLPRHVALHPCGVLLSDDVNSTDAFPRFASEQARRPLRLAHGMALLQK